MIKPLIIIGLLLMMGCYGGYSETSPYGGYTPPRTYIKSGDSLTSPYGGYTPPTSYIRSGDMLLGPNGKSCIVSGDLVICN